MPDRDDIHIYRVQTDDLMTITQLACAPAQLPALMHREFAGHPYRVQGTVVTILSETSAAMPPDAVAALPPTLELSGATWTVRHVGGQAPDPRPPPRTVLVECAPLRGWRAGQRPHPDTVQRWAQDPARVITEDAGLLIELEHDLVYVLGAWGADTPARLAEVMAHRDAGKLNPHALSFRELVRQVEAVQSAEHRRLQERAAQIRAEVAQLTQQLTGLLREQSAVSTLAATPVPTVDLATILQRTRAVDGVVSLSARGRSILLETFPITIRAGSDHYDIGEFTIAIDVVRGEITFRNHTRQVSGHHHPHIFGNGGACFGEISAVIPELISRFMLPELATVLVRFLRSVNLQDSAGRTITAWPKVRTSAAA